MDRVSNAWAYSSVPCLYLDDIKPIVFDIELSKFAPTDTLSLMKSQIPEPAFLMPSKVALNDDDNRLNPLLAIDDKLSKPT